MLKIKPGVKLQGLAPEMALAAHVIDGAFWLHGSHDAVITSALDGHHMLNSFHFMGKALDFRTKHVLDSVILDLIIDDIIEALGEEFDVVLESDHLHVEFDPD